MVITSISNNVLGEASQAMDSGVYLVQCVQCSTVPNSGVLVTSKLQKSVIFVAYLYKAKRKRFVR